MTGYIGPPDPAYRPLPQPSWPLPPQPPRPSVLPVISIVISAIALIGVAALSILGGVGGEGSLGDDSLGGSAPLTGQVQAPPSGTVAGAELAKIVEKVVIDDGGDVAELRCPDTPQLKQGAVTVCHGTISSEAWAIVVVFEDPDGNFTAVPT
jgi:uncharacterized protein DUF4333